jgi:hypothetical protein
MGLDAAFKRNTDLPRPSELLLHYNYGAAVVKHWHCHTHLLSGRHRRNIPRSPPAQVKHEPAGPSRTIHDRTQAIQNVNGRAMLQAAIKGKEVAPENGMLALRNGTRIIQTQNRLLWKPLMDQLDGTKMTGCYFSGPILKRPVSVGGLLKNFHLASTSGQVKCHMVALGSTPYSIAKSIAHTYLTEIASELLRISIVWCRNDLPTRHLCLLVWPPGSI